MPKVSVVIPAYNQAKFLGETLQSVLDQTYSDFEVIVVNDASPDHTAEVVQQFTDPRVKYILHDENRGLPAARNTGMRASSGELIALLDSDDIFHPEKLEKHIKFHEQHPDIGITYNARFELDHSSTTIRELWSPPLSVDLSHLVLGWPFSPSDMVLRREWMNELGLFNETLVSGGEDLEFPCRLALAGCQFARVEGVLNYRRYHSGRLKKRLDHRLADYKYALQTVFTAPHCPASVLALASQAYANSYLEVAWYALAQGEISPGQEWLCEAVRLVPNIVEGEPSALVNFFVVNSIVDKNLNHEALLQSIFSYLPGEMMPLGRQLDWAIARGYLLRGTRAIIWGQCDEGHEYFSHAGIHHADIDESFLRKLTDDLLNYEQEFGYEAKQKALQALTPYLQRIGKWNTARRLNGLVGVNRAFRSYDSGQYDHTIRRVVDAVFNDPRHLVNRGVLAILLRSVLHKYSRPSNYRQDVIH